MRILAFAFIVFAAPAEAHEFWIEPTDYQVEADGSLEADIVNGEEFAGVKLAYLPQRFVNFVLFAGDASARVTGRTGDTPALQQEPVAEGLNIAAYQANSATVDYENWERFQRFVDHKDFGDVLSQHEARGLPLENFTEVYSRYSKSLIGVGNSAGADRRVGLETEIVALTNPYTDDLSDGFQVQVYYRNDLRANTQVEVFEKAADSQVSISLYQTDENGIATFPVRPGYSYMVDAVVLREPNERLAELSGAVWETLWANLTFAVPD
ncbi:Uncharacterized conserved protein, contains GH25 family domain [Yoonia rosea]|uniref:Uncharacterized conserved protein, contains GH25 family domain n=1 Tax=Yoonia rosea TaxID=287098 RepID=A0A1R3WKL2_9RHOB|nr:DUF4198 domain-containing protein [Yoonia rosea]SIT78457.1 Uncharacterized conserved protein, contains GH25 family domain [Yoonia rosea]